MGEGNGNGVNNDNSVVRIPGEAIKILVSLASKWVDVVDPKALEVIPLKGAMTNEVYQIHWPSQKDGDEVPRKVVVRIYGEGVEVFFDREVEIQTFECMSKHGQGPRLLGRFPTGRVEEFIHARTLSAADLREPEVSALIAAKLREFHQLQMTGSKDVILWSRMRNWLGSAKRLCPPEEAKAFIFGTIEAEIPILERALSGENQLMGFCHNDLQYGNIMIDEETNSITIIDYEYASYNPVAYDLANHFCEMAADYHSETPHILDYEKYPDLEERKRFVHVYLSASGNEPSEVEVEQLVQDVEKYTTASHLFWALWGIISTVVGCLLASLAKAFVGEVTWSDDALPVFLFDTLTSDSEHVNEIDFDYMEYAKQRFQQYQLRKSTLMSSSTAPLDDNSSNANGVDCCDKVDHQNL